MFGVSVLDGIALSLRFSSDRKRCKTQQIAFQTRKPRFPSEVKSVTATLHYQPSQNPSTNLYNQQQPRTIKSHQQLSKTNLRKNIKNHQATVTHTEQQPTTYHHRIHQELYTTNHRKIHQEPPSNSNTHRTTTKNQPRASKEPTKRQQEHLRKNAVGSPV